MSQRQPEQMRSAVQLGLEVGSSTISALGAPHAVEESGGDSREGVHTHVQVFGPVVFCDEDV